MIRRTLFTALAVIVLALPAMAAEPEFLNREDSIFKAEGFPFSEAVRVGDLIFLSGQIGTKPGTVDLIEGDIETQTLQTLENIEAVLAANGLGRGDVVKCLVMLENIGDWERMNAVYKAFFTPPYPTRSALGADGLALGALVEIECIAAAD